MKPKTISDVRMYPEQRRDPKTNSYPTENLPVIAKFSYQGNRLEYNTGIKVQTSLNRKGESAWDVEKGRAARNTFHHGLSFSEINAELDRVATAIIKVYDRHRLSGTPLPIVSFREGVRQMLGTEKLRKDRVIDIFDLFVEENIKTKKWKDGLAKHFKVIRGQLKDVIKNLTIDQVDISIFEKYKSYMLSNGTRNSTIENKLKRLKWFLRWAIREGYLKGEIIQRIDRYSVVMDKITESDRMKQNIVFLYPDEINTIEILDIPDEKGYLQKVRDCFLFSCYTGLRHSDLKALKKSNVDYEEDMIRLVTLKDNELLAIPLVNKSREILLKYKNEPGEQALPVFSNQKMNQYLKELGFLAKLDRQITKTYYMGTLKRSDHFELWELLSSHVGRRTFITRAIELGIPPDVVMSLSGHSDYKVMQVYLGIREERRKIEMQKFNEI
ncbi:MAG: hypothetical protein CVT98_07905 [Bacteroidetes bacterium HGW-Bacteroidetes-15]|nr:MAG: hypothetical protein CVT98_07905 [Bacteroidetes bacterium HGW-Bacteroidetes-15]